jgi:heterodisulfide reductase subunit A
VENEVLPTQIIQQFSENPDLKNSENNNFGDVMVVGGGVSGIQASLDLATAGFKVYLVEKGPSIGGHMAQLDKTFPTNDCSM